jgi:serine/threonine protein kinase
MSPEVVFKKPYNENIDVWALGVLLYELVHGRSPHSAKDLKEIDAYFKSQNLIRFDNEDF